jgi:hypothetical protein
VKVYLAGKIGGTTDYHERFAKYAQKLRQEGYSVYNPAAANQEGRTQAAIMAHLLPILCDHDAIALMPDWIDSEGAKLERQLAEYCGKAVIEL